MSLYKQFKNDESLESTGVRAEFGKNSKGAMTTFIVARAGGANKRHLKAGERILKPYRRQLQTETMPRDLLERKMMEVFIDGSLLNWENVEDENDNPLPFTRENAIKLFSDLPDLYAQVKAVSEDAALFRATVDEVDAGN